MESKNKTPFTIMKKMAYLGINLTKMFYAEKYKILITEIRELTNKMHIVEVENSIKLKYLLFPN